MNDFELVGELYKHFGYIPENNELFNPHMIEDDEANFRIKFLQEELNELRKGYEDQDICQIADALVDLVVVALGTAQLHSLPWNELFIEVQRANMSKQRGMKSTRGWSSDLVKPDGWIAPRIFDVIQKTRHERLIKRLEIKQA